MTTITIQTHSGVSPLSKSSWDALVADQSPFLEHGFLATLEETGCLDESSGWTPVIFTAHQDGELVGAVPFYLKVHSAGEFVFDWAWADAALRAGIPYYPKGVVAVPFTPVTGARILTRPGVANEAALKKALIEAVLDFVDQQDLSSVHFNFLPSEDLPLFEDLGLPTRIGIQYHFRNDDGSGTPFQDFDGYLSGFRSKTRANIRRERRILRDNQVTTEIRRGPDLQERDLAFLFQCYRDTVQKFFYGQQYLNEDFFLTIGEALPQRLHTVFIAHDGERFGGTFNLAKNRRLYGRYWGALRDLRFAHFEACIYRPVQWCIDEGFTTFEPGAGGEHKYDRGFLPTLTYSAHYLRHPALRRGVTRFLDDERQHILTTRQRLIDEGPLKNFQA